jgi:AraC-like DNA-binding protein
MMAWDAEEIFLSSSKRRQAVLPEVLLIPKPGKTASQRLKQSAGKPKPVVGAKAATGDLSSLDVTRLQEYQQLTRRYLDRRISTLFRELTGMPFQVAWAPPWPRRWTVETLPAGSFSCCQRKPASAPPGCSLPCAAQHLALALKSGPAGHRFNCHREVSHLWLPIRVLDLTVGLAFVQALDGLSPFPPRGAGTSSAAQGAGRLRAAKPRPGGKHKRFHRQQFDRAAHLLRFMVHRAETASLASLREVDLAGLHHAIVKHESEQARVRRELHRVLPIVDERPPVPEPVSRVDQIVRWILNCIEEHSPKPVTMQFCADSLGLTPSYLSSLFSQKVGLPFRCYIGELRLEKARQLLSDPASRIADVAAAVGYAGENSFRLAFKKATGLSPAAWRESLRTQGH